MQSLSLGIVHLHVSNASRCRVDYGSLDLMWAYKVRVHEFGSQLGNSYQDTIIVGDEGFFY